MTFNDVKGWQGTAEDLCVQLKRKIEQLQLSIEPPTVRVIRSWRSRKLLSQPKGQKFGFRQILEGLVTLSLLEKGWTLVAITASLSSRNDLELEQQILAETDSDQTTLLFKPKDNNHLAIAKDAIILLAQGILRQYTRVLTGIEIVRQNEHLPAELHVAMCKLGRLYLSEGKCDRAACLHDVLDYSRYPLNHQKWDLDIFKQIEYHPVQLIDYDLRVPTAECAEIAKKSRSFGEDNVIQSRLYSQLKTATERLGNRKKDQAYTCLRELIGRRSLIKEIELFDYLIDHNLTPLQKTIIEFFDPVSDTWLINGYALRCAHCGTLIRPHPHRDRYPQGYCPIHQCNSRYPPKVGERINPQQDNVLIAKPQILVYWTAPAIDELAIFDRAKTYGLEAQLYPNYDECDIAINHYEVGIDAKSYRSPVLLALKLNRSIGGLIHYRKRIIAITDEMIKNYPDYISTVYSLLDQKSDTNSLKIMSVSTVIQNIKEGKYAN
ncbi:MAG: hypothetical protein WBA13_19145 [Microcoleaceae cyanobacterium]